MPRHGGSWRDVMVAEIAPLLEPGMLERIHFLGHVPYARYLQVLQVSRVHVYLTYPFILSWSLLEAMAMGCLVVASQTPAVEEVIQDGQNGLLVPFHWPQVLAGQVVDAISNPKQHEQVTAQARQSVREHFDFKTRVLPRHLQLLAQLQQQDALTHTKPNEAVH
jgi:glycosyltransferase involved in cell wall biosynthesis